MTTPTPETTTENIDERSQFIIWLSKLPGARWLNDQKIGPKLSFGFGALVILTFLVIGFSLFAGTEANRKITITNDTRLPIVTAASEAQANLLRMQAGVRGYLALGRPEFRASYSEAQSAFETNLTRLESLASGMDTDNQDNLRNLREIYNQWKTLPEPLFDLRDDRLEREPAYEVLAIDGVFFGGTVLIELQNLIDLQAAREPTAANIELLKDMAKFQGYFAAMFSGLRNYTGTQDRILKQEYDANVAVENIHWNRLVEQSDEFTAEQSGTFEIIRASREAFFELPENQIIPILESDQARMDLFEFRTKVVPDTEEMLNLLNTLTTTESQLLVTDLNDGHAGLSLARTQTVVVGVAAVVFGIALAVILQANIAGPITRLTRVAESIRDGNLEATATVESNDETGILAQAFNQMTNRLSQTLRQVQKEKTRADNLLHVVIPIGVELSSEKDFNRLLEKMLVEAQEFCHADAGSVYLRQGKELEFVIVRNKSLNLAMGGTTGQEIQFAPLPLYNQDETPNEENVATYTALTGRSINIPDAYSGKEGFAEFSGPMNFDKQTGYRTTSVLTIALKDNENQVTGVLQLLNAKDPQTNEIIPFDANLQQMMESFSMLASAALEAYRREQALRQEIQQLRIEIDEAKLQKQVSETVETDFFQELQSKARDIRRRRRRGQKQEDKTK